MAATQGRNPGEAVRAGVDLSVRSLVRPPPLRRTSRAPGTCATDFLDLFTRATGRTVERTAEQDAAIANRRSATAVSSSVSAIGIHFPSDRPRTASPVDAHAPPARGRTAYLHCQANPRHEPATSHPVDNPAQREGPPRPARHGTPGELGVQHRRPSTPSGIGARFTCERSGATGGAAERAVPRRRARTGPAAEPDPERTPGPARTRDPEPHCRAGRPRPPDVRSHVRHARRDVRPAAGPR